MNVNVLFQQKNIKYGKFILVFLVFGIWLLFFDKHNLKDQFEYQGKISGLKSERDYFISKIKEDSLRLYELNTSDENLEKFVREKYYMKKKGEQIFLLKKQDKK